MIRVKVTESGQIDFMDLIKRVKNPRPMLSEIGDIIREDIQHRIKNTKTTPDGTAWAPWAQSTLKARTQDGTAGLGLLFRTGTLYNSLLKNVSSKEVNVFSSAPYAGYLQNGTKNMPARPFIGISENANKDIDQFVRSYLGIK